MSHPLPSQNWKWTPYLAIGGALVLAALLFLLIPLTQMLNAPEQPDLTVREVRITPPPPPATPPLPEEVDPPEPQQPTPEMPSEPTPVELQPLDVTLSPGSGDAIAMGASMPSFETEREAVAEVQKLFNFDDLPEDPRVLYRPDDFRFPSSLARRGVDMGKVILEIDILPDGTAEVRRIVSSTHRELEPVARRIVERTRFTKPTVNGRPQRVRGIFPLVLQN